MFFKLIEKLNYSKKFRYFICTPLIYSIGTASEQIALAAEYSLKYNKKLILFKVYLFKKILNYNICNEALFNSLIINNINIKKNSIYKIVEFLIQIEFAIRRISSILIKNFLNIEIGENYRFPHLGLVNLKYNKENDIDYNDLAPLNFKNSEIRLNERDKEKCLKKLSEYDYDKKKIVCLHVRDSGYYNDANRRQYRNSNINNYLELIEFLTKKDYLIFRLGNISSNKINYENKSFIDCTSSEFNTDLMNIFLIDRCDFYIGTPSGPLDTAYLFKKPVLITNHYDLFPSFPRKKIDRSLFKKIKCKKTGKTLTLEDFANLNIHYHQTLTDINDLFFEENSSEELLNSIKEYLNLIENKNRIIFTDDQINFNKLLSSRLENIYKEEVVNLKYFKKEDYKKSHFIRIIKRFKSCEGAILNYSLKNNS